MTHTHKSKYFHKEKKRDIQEKKLSWAEGQGGFHGTGETIWPL